MNIINSTWGRGIIGAGVAGILITWGLLMYPLAGHNAAAHMLIWAFSGIIGLKIALSAFENLDHWAVATDEALIPDARSREARSISLEGPRRSSIPVLNANIRHQSHPGTATLPEPIRARGVGERITSDRKQEAGAWLRFASENPVCSLATVDPDGHPRVRTVFLWRVDSSGFYLVLFSTKQVSRQVKAHPQVELCFRNHSLDLTQAKQLRVSGEMQLVTNKKLLDSAASEQFLWKNLAAKNDETHLEIFRLPVEQMKFWSVDGFVENHNAVETALV